MLGVLSREGSRDLIRDTDNHGNVALSFGVNPDIIELSIYDVLVDGLDPMESILNVHENIDILPANDAMSFYEFDVFSDSAKHSRPFSMLKKAFEKVTLTSGTTYYWTPRRL